MSISTLSPGNKSLLKAGARIGANLLIPKLLGSGDPISALQDYKPLLAAGGGLTSSLRNNTISAGATPARRSAVAGLGDIYSSYAGELSALLPQVAIGTSDLRKAALNAVENARARSRSDLRGDMERRRLGGSSFAADTLSRSDAEFSQIAAEVESSAFLKEFEMATKVMEQRTAAELQALQVFLDESNLEADFALKLVQSAQGILGQNQQTLATLLAQDQAGQGAFARDLIDEVFGVSRDAAGNILSGAGAASSLFSGAGLFPDSAGLGLTLAREGGAAAGLDFAGSAGLDFGLSAGVPETGLTAGIGGSQLLGAAGAIGVPLAVMAAAGGFSPGGVLGPESAQMRFSNSVINTINAAVPFGSTGKVTVPVGGRNQTISVVNQPISDGGSPKFPLADGSGRYLEVDPMQGVTRIIGGAAAKKKVEFAKKATAVAASPGTMSLSPEHIAGMKRMQTFQPVDN